jgi:transcriptional regulator with XRE-family HTH domain
MPELKQLINSRLPAVLALADHDNARIAALYRNLLLEVFSESIESFRKRLELLGFARLPMPPKSVDDARLQLLSLCSDIENVTEHLPLDLKLRLTMNFASFEEFDILSSILISNCLRERKPLKYNISISEFQAFIGRSIARIRKSRGLKQKELARGVGVALSSIVRYESNRQRLSLDILYAIAKFLQVSPVEFLPPETLGLQEALAEILAMRQMLPRFAEFLEKREIELRTKINSKNVSSGSSS